MSALIFWIWIFLKISKTDVFIGNHGCWRNRIWRSGYELWLKPTNRIQLFLILVVHNIYLNIQIEKLSKKWMTVNSS